VIRPPAKLKGRRVWFYRDPGGFRSGIVRRVHAGPRKGLMALTVETFDGRRLKLQPKAWAAKGQPTGLAWRGRIVPMELWLAGGVK